MRNLAADSTIHSTPTSLSWRLPADCGQLGFQVRFRAAAAGDVQSHLKEGARGTSVGSGRLRFRRGLVIVELALGFRNPWACAYSVAGSSTRQTQRPPSTIPFSSSSHAAVMERILGTLRETAEAN